VLALLAAGGSCGPPERRAAPVEPVKKPFAFDARAPATLPSAPDAPDSRATRFVDVAVERGVDHVYANGEAGRSLMVETMGGGAGWLDADGDGRPDLFLNQGGDATSADRHLRPPDRLFLNRGTRGFADATGGSRIDDPGYGQGVAVGDFDDDGFDDLYVTNVDGNTLWHNLGDGTFEDVTRRAGVRDGRWSTSAGWADLDGDGDLDLYVCNYLRYDPLDPLECLNARGEPRICHPRDVAPWNDECYRNQGDGTFEPAAAAMGLTGPGGKALGVVLADLTGDGVVDVYVANDTEANFLFVGDGAGRFVERGIESGAAVDRTGATQASMGVAAGDYDADGLPDLHCTHFRDESNTLYRNLGMAGFEDVTALVDLHEPTLPFLGFGTVMEDFDCDGRQEILVTNGHIENFPGNPLLRMRPQLFEWDGRRFVEQSRAAGPFFTEKRVGRGLATADFDGDGDLDAVVVHQNAPSALLENRSDRGGWLAIDLRGTASNRRGVGARVRVTAGDRILVRQLMGGTSYASSHEPVLVFGLADHDRPVDVEVAWPAGGIQTLRGVAPNRRLVISEPSATP
jgi:hypothetical protein